jgi:hypothetical protein
MVNKLNNYVGELRKENKEKKNGWRDKGNNQQARRKKMND